MKWRIDYSDEAGAGDFDYSDYDTKQAAVDEAHTRLASGDMPWAVTARVFPINDDGEPHEDQSIDQIIRRHVAHIPRHSRSNISN